MRTEETLETPIRNRGPEPRAAGVGQGATIVVAAFLPIMAIVSLAPAVPSFFKHFGAMPNATTLIPLLVTAPGLMIALFAPAMGWATDRVGRRPILLAATLVYGFFGVAPFFLDTLGPIFATRLGVGVAEAAILTVTNTLIGDYFTPERRRTWLTVQGIVGPIFGTSVIALSGVLTESHWNGAFLIYAVALPIFVAMVLFIYEPASALKAEHEPAAAAGPFPWATVMTFSAVTLFSSTLYYVFIVQGGLAFDAIGVKSPKTLGLFISIASIGVPIGAIIFGLLSKKGSPALLVATYLTCLGLGMIGIGLARDPKLMAALAMIQQVGAGMAVPSLIFWATGALSPAHRGRGMGFWAAAFFLGQFTSPILVGAARSATGGILGSFAVLGVVALVGAVVAFVMSRRLPAGARTALA